MDLRVPDRSQLSVNPVRLASLYTRITIANLLHEDGVCAQLLCLFAIFTITLSRNHVYALITRAKGNTAHVDDTDR